MKSGWLGVGLVLGSLSPSSSTATQILQTDSVTSAIRQTLRGGQPDTSKVKLLVQLAQRYQQRGIADSAFYYAKQSLHLAKQGNNPLNLGRAYSQLGDYYFYRSNYSQSYAAYQKSIPFLQLAANSTEAAHAMYLLALIHIKQGNVVQAIDQLTKNLGYATRTGNTARTGATYALLYSLHLKLNDKKSALADLDAMRQLAEQTNSPPDLWLAYGNLANWYSNESNPTLAELYWQKDIRAAQQWNSPAIYVNTYCSYASHLLKQNKLQRAETFLNKAYKQAHTDRSISTANIDLLLAQIREKQNRLKEANHLVSHALGALQKEHTFQFEEGLSVLARVQKKQGQYKQALDNFVRLKSLSDSLREEKKNQAIIAIESRYRFDKNEADMALLKKNLAIQQLDLARANQQNIIYILAAGGFCLILLLVGWFGWQARQNVRKLTHQQLEINKQAAHLMELNAVKDKLFNIISHDLRAPVATLKQHLEALPSFPTIDQMNRVKRTTNILYTTLDNLLHWTTMQRNGIVTRPISIDLSELIIESLELLSPLARDKQIQVDYTPQPMITWVDEYQIQIVFRNILHNAIKHSPLSGRIRIDCQSSPEQTIVTIQDSGKGMQARLDQPDSFSLTENGTSGERGTGLGLVVSREFMKYNGGHLSIHSEIAKGTLVTLTFLIHESAIKGSTK